MNITYFVPFFIIFALAFLAVIFGPRYQFKIAGLEVTNQKDRVNQINEFRKTWLQGVGGFVVIFGLVFTALQITTTRQGQISDLYVEASKLIGNKNPLIRLGGISVLERIIVEYESDQERIIHMFINYVRKPELWTEEVVVSEEVENGQKKQIPIDVQEILNILGKPEIKKQFKDGQIVLNGARLPGAKFHSLIVNNIRFYQAQLENTDFYNTELRKAYFHKANLNGTKFINCDLEEAVFTEANYLNNTQFLYSNLKNSNFINACGEKTIFRGGSLFNSNFSKAILIGAKFVEGIDLEEVSFKDANLESAEIYGNNIRYEQLIEANSLYKAIFDQKIMDRIKNNKNYSFLLEKPKENERLK